MLWGFPCRGRQLPLSGRRLARPYCGRNGFRQARRNDLCPKLGGSLVGIDVQNRCKICPDGVGGVADIVCADAWYGGKSGYPAFEERDGRSLIIARTALGAAYLRLRLKPKQSRRALRLDEIDAMQPGQVRKKRVLSARLAAFRLALQPIPRMKGLQVLDAARFASWREILTNFLGSCRRIYRRVLTRIRRSDAFYADLYSLSRSNLRRQCPEGAALKFRSYLPHLQV